MANDITYRITGDATSFKSAMSQVEAATAATTGKVNAASRSVESLGAKLSSVGSAMTLGITAPAAALGVAVVKTAADMEALKNGLGAVTKESGSLETQLARLKEVAKLPGLGFKEAILDSTSLQAAGFSAQLAERSLKAFGNALATVGKGKAELDGVTLALSQIASKGKISAEEINQLAERVPQIRVAMKDAFGTADTEVLQKAGIGAEEFVTKVVAQLEKLKQVTGGTKNSFENLGDAVTQAAERVGQKLLPSINAVIPKIEAMVTAAADGVDAFTRLSPEAQNLALTLGGVAIAAGPVISVIGKLSASITSMQAIAGAAGAAMVGLFAVTLVAAVAQTLSSIDKLNEKYKALKEFQDRLKTGQQDLINGFKDDGKPLGGGANISSGGMFDQPASAVRKYGIDLKALSTELGLFTGETKKAEPPVKALGAAVEKASNIIKVASVGQLIYVESLERVKAAMSKVKDVMFEYQMAGTLLGNTLETHPSILDASTLAAREYVARLGDIRRELENMPAPRVEIVNQGNMRRGSVFETDDILGSASSRNQAQRVTQAEADLARIKQLNAEGKATGNDVITAQQNLKKAMEETGRAAVTSGKAQTKALQQVSTVVTDLSRGIAGIIFEGGKFGDMMQKVAKQAGQAITRELIEGALTKLSKKLLDVGGIFGTVFGGGTGVVKSVSGGMGDLGGAVSGGGKGAASAIGGAASGIMGAVTGIAAVGSLISGIVGNFQMAGMNKSLDLIEHEVRYSQIHLLNMLNKANEFWPYAKSIWESLIRMETAGGFGGGGGTVNVSMAGAYLMSDAQMGDFADRLARFLKARGI